MHTPWAAPAAEVLDSLKVTPTGLSAEDAAHRLEHHGPNRLPEPPRDGFFKRLLGHLNDILIFLLLAAAAVKAIMGEWVDFSVILAVAVINVAIGLIQEGRALRALDAIKAMLSSRAKVLRDGHLTNVDADELVPGDVIRLAPGDRVPADARLLDAANLAVEESALTGESVAAEKSTALVPADAQLGDRTSMLYSSTLVVAGTATAVVTGTAANTEIGRIQTMIADADNTETPLARTLGKFGKQLAWLILGMSAFMILIGWLVHNLQGRDLISAAIGFAVAAIPEGLPALVTITLALGVQQMARRRAISRKMAAVETLGSVSTICSDKTGTLTQNEMTVRDVRTRAGSYRVAGGGYAPIGDILSDGAAITVGSRPDVTAVAEVMGLANNAELLEESGRWKLIGEPTEGGVLVMARKAGVTGEGWSRLAEIPFDSATKYMATLSQNPVGERVVLVKGGLDAVLARCTSQLGPDGANEPIDAAFWEAQHDELSSGGLRVLAAAHAAAAAGDELPEDGPRGLTLLGIVGIVDPPRPEAIAAISEARDAGIAVTMITGDHAGTAKAIAKEMGIIDTLDSLAITGVELEAMSDEELAAVVQSIHVYARTSPEHKIRIVRALQTHGEVVAMTGDGVNDAPALTQADVGVAMGIKGTEATKETADIVLADDNFATIERAVAEGRRIYDNIRKAVLFLLPTNGAQSFVILTAILFGWAVLPLEPVQVLWINMITAVTLSLPLANEQAEPGLMRRPPRDPNVPLLTGPFLRRILFVSVLISGATLALFYAKHSAGMPTTQAQGLAVTMLTLGQMAYLFNCRFLDRSSITWAVFRGNSTLWWSCAAMLGLQLTFLYAPFMQQLFRVQPITLTDWGITALCAIGIFLAVEAAKAVGRKRNPAQPGRRA